MAFADGRIYVATDFGLVVYDSKRHPVLESGIFGKDVAHIFVMGDHPVLLMGNSLMAAPLEGRHNTESCFTAIGDILAPTWPKSATPCSPSSTPPKWSTPQPSTSAL